MPRAESLAGIDEGSKAACARIMMANVNVDRMAFIP